MPTRAESHCRFALRCDPQHAAVRLEAVAQKFLDRIKDTLQARKVGVSESERESARERERERDRDSDRDRERERLSERGRGCMRVYK